MSSSRNQRRRRIVKSRVRHRLANLFALATLVACSESAVLDPPVRAALSAVETDGFEHEPVLVMTKVCYAICPRTFALPEFAVYPNGTLVAIDREPPGEYDSPFRIRSFELTQSDLDRVAELFLIGKLATGDVHSAGTRAGVADGGGIVFETIVGVTRTYVHAPFLEAVDTDPTRDALFEMRTLFRSYAEKGQGTDLSIRWVMVGDAHTDPASVPWPGVGRPVGEPPCLEFDLADVPAELDRLTLQDPNESASVSFARISHRMTARPLLPHENGCEGVQAQFHRIFANDESLDLGGAG